MPQAAEPGMPPTEAPGERHPVCPTTPTGREVRDHASQGPRCLPSRPFFIKPTRNVTKPAGPSWKRNGRNTTQPTSQAAGHDPRLGSPSRLTKHRPALPPARCLAPIAMDDGIRYHHKPTQARLRKLPRGVGEYLNIMFLRTLTAEESEEGILDK